MLPSTPIFKLTFLWNFPSSTLHKIPFFPVSFLFCLSTDALRVALSNPTSHLFHFLLSLEIKQLRANLSPSRTTPTLFSILSPLCYHPPQSSPNEQNQNTHTPCPLVKKHWKSSTYPSRIRHLTRHGGNPSLPLKHTQQKQQARISSLTFPTSCLQKTPSLDAPFKHHHFPKQHFSHLSL